MGLAFSSLIKRPIKNFNVEHKAHKLIDKNVKPKVAPQHPSSVDYINKYVEENKDILKKELKEKNEVLHDRLKGMIVEASKSHEIQMKQNAKKYPQIRTKMEDLEYGYSEPDKVKDGFVTIKQTMEFLSKHFTDPPAYPAENIAKDYNLKLDDVKKILRYFNVFVLQIPKKPISGDESSANLLKTSTLKKWLIDGGNKKS